MLITAIKENLAELSNLLLQLPPNDYTRRFPELGNATIGEHVRHILELYACLEKAYISGMVEYDNRKRDILLQTQPEAALEAISHLEKTVGKPNKDLQLRFMNDGCEQLIPTNYERELLYNLEHSIHHQALIKVGLRHLDVNVGEDFGLAKSTIAYRNQCAQ
ncbi:DinB family protein [Flavobacterium selenitireducens]|uniref:DinB family protein n=1 Tax=Flavobacterium selenitireducens TaxID=2722704 RepID=UPI00168A779E|nr:DinB family protein [Flavobacterium selenitireducens]MBD3583672.1 DinB family protein [Flavobacterium selenitireducens]